MVTGDGVGGGLEWGWGLWVVGWSGDEALLAGDGMGVVVGWVTYPRSGGLDPESES